MIETIVLKEIIEEGLKGTDRFLVELNITPDDRIDVRIDGTAGVTIEHCVELSRFIESKLDRDAKDYALEVSSVGADKPLQHKQQYVKNTGREIEIILNDGTQFYAILDQVTEEGVMLKPAEKRNPKNAGSYKRLKDPKTVTFSEITEAKVVLKFN